jgi:2-oxoglutarate dehydrogenase E1 component
MDLLKEVGHAISQVPQNFHANGKILRQLEAKRKMIESGEGIDWGTGEALAFGTLLCESTSIRLSGEDSERGTFSQRHSVLIDQQNEQRYVPLNSIRMGQAPFEVIDSPLSEFGLLGFEYGYASAEPHALVLWEAQFGDFANGAQVIIDQFISSGEAKWLRMCGLVMLLPHGYEGQGPEHSSARLERYLQNSAEDNWQVCNITQPANYFHALRRQVRRNFRKPLILMTPKSLLRHKKCVSKLEEFGPGTSFHRVLWDNAQLEPGRLAPDDKIKRVILCSGKVYFDLEAQRDAEGIEDIYIMRLEQLYPFPFYALGQELSRFPNADIVWCQEEPENMGAWQFLDRRIERVLDEIGHKPARRPHYVGRDAAASPATGIAKRHADQQAHIVEQALSLKSKTVTVGGVKVGGVPALSADAEAPPTSTSGGGAKKASAKRQPATKSAAKKAGAKKAAAKKAGAKKAGAKAAAKKATAKKTSAKKTSAKKAGAKKASAKKATAKKATAKKVAAKKA